MLPSNPRAGRSRSAVRQPAPSQPSSASRPRECYAGDEDRATRGRNQDGGYARQVRSQRSMGNIPSSRSRREPAAPPMPTFRRLEDDGRSVRSSPATYTRPPPSRSSESSDSSVSSSGSSGSSFLDRMRNRGAPSSSQSSFELDLDNSKETLPVEKNSRKHGAIHDEQSLAANDLVSYGYSIWNRVATAASTWSWTGTSNGSITGVAPSSGDSEITRALKAYHISKARDRSDLPEWLFDERERRVDTQKPTHRARNDDRNYIEETQRATGARGRSFRDIYDSVATSTPESRPREGFGASGRSIASDPLERSNTRVADRLKAIRDAKRPAVRVEQGYVPAMPSVERGHVDQRDRRYEDRLSSRRGGPEVFREPTERNTPGRVGLPTNPRRR